MSQVLTIVTGIVAIGAALAALTRWVFAPAFRFARLWARFFEDFFGRPERPGVPGVPGIMERLAKIEHQTGRTEFHLGNGNPVPMRKIVEDVDERTAGVERRLSHVEETVETHHPTAPTAASPDVPSQ